MRWNFSGTGTNKTEVLKSFREAQAKDTHCPFPDVVTAAVEALAAPFPEGAVSSINTYGHINTDGTGNVKVSINC